MDTTSKCLPVYVLIDTSGSMKPFEKVLNDSLEELFDTLMTSPRISEFAHVSIISFNTDVEVVLGVLDLHQVTQLPDLECGGATNFRAALELLRSQIDIDVPALRVSGYQVLRPVIFLLTDGRPTDAQGYLSEDWRSAFSELRNPSWSRRPNLVPFGYGGAQEEFLRDVATIKDAAFLAKKGETSDALAKVVPALLNSLVSSAHAQALRVPADLDGFIRVSSEVVD